MTQLRHRTGRTVETHTFSPIRFDIAYPDVRKEFYVPARAVPVPEAHILSTSRAWAALKGDTYAIPEDFVASIRNALYCTTNRVVMGDRVQVLVESMNGAETFSESLAPILTSAHGAIDDIDGHATLFDSNFNGYYHQLVEMVPRLLAINRLPYTEIDEIKLLCPRAVYPITKLILTRFNKLRLRPLHAESGRILRLENLLFTPFKSRQFAGYLPQRYVHELRKIVFPHRPSLRRHRIFISRERSNKRRLRNEDDLMAAISRLGFEKYVLEDLTPEEQIELFYDADAVVGTHGAGLTNVLFSPQTRVLELFPRDFVEPHYLFLCKSLGHPYRFWLNTTCSRLEFEYVTLRLRQRMERSKISNRSGSHPGGRSINLSYSVNVREVTSILAEMGVR